MQSTHLSCEVTIRNYNWRMRLAKVAMGFAVLAIAIWVFYYSSKIGDLISPFRPYLVSDAVTYVRRKEPGGEMRYYQLHDFYVKGLTLARAQKVGHDSFNGHSGTTSYLTPLRSGGLPKGSPPPMAGHIKYWAALKWNEILWVRLVHIGTDPFTEEAPWI